MPDPRKQAASQIPTTSYGNGTKKSLPSPHPSSPLGLNSIPLQTGVLVNAVEKLSGAHNVLKKDDVILTVDGQRIANDGTVPFRRSILTLIIIYFFN